MKYPIERLNLIMSKEKFLTSFIINAVIVLVAAAFIYRIAYSEHRSRHVEDFINHSEIK